MSFSGIYLTNVGRAALSKVQATQATLNFTRFAFGDGQLGGGLEVERTTMISEQDTQPITKLRINGDNTVTIGTKRPGDAPGGYYFRELGLFITDPDNSAAEILYAYANAGSSAQYIPENGSAEIVQKTINIIASISNTINVSATITTGVYVTPEELDEHNTSDSAHNTRFAAKQAKINATGILKGDGLGGVTAASDVDDFTVPPARLTALPASNTALTNNAEYRVASPVGTYIFKWPDGNFEVWLKFTTAASGVAISFPAGTKHINGAPVFSGSKTYEMSVKDGVVICQEVTTS